ncbi:MAG: hypothetical protein SVW02_03365 [Candidatus Nanohaloarchaea archaeon]|nr:hypothetical protein [Candidatus Nanohaloarchaea archaeon]
MSDDPYPSRGETGLEVSDDRRKNAPYFESFGISPDEDLPLGEDLGGGSPSDENDYRIADNRRLSDGNGVSAAVYSEDSGKSGFNIGAGITAGHWDDL